jgi:hypothetical protein
MTQPDTTSGAEFLGAQQRRDHHVATGLELAVDLDHDPVP